MVLKIWHGVVAVLGLFVVGIVPLLLTSSGADAGGLVTRQTLGAVALSDDAETNGSPLELPATSSPFPSTDSLDCPSKDLRLLVVAADGEENTLAAIREVLDYVGTPYTVYVAADDPGGLTAERLSAGCRGFYSGVILTNGTLAYDPEGDGTARSALTDAELETLEEYEAGFDVRRVAWYAYPNSEYGFEEPTSVEVNTPIETRLTSAGEKVFGYVNAENPVVIKDAYAYLAAPEDGTTTPLLSDDAGNALAAVKEHSDGRETLALTFDSAPRLPHNRILAYGLVDWVTQGLFLGDRRVYLGAQVDDVFLPNELATGETYRITGDDLRAVLDWQEETRTRPVAEGLRLDMAYNAYGTTGSFVGDALTPLARENQDEFKWISHTYKHLDLDEVDYRTALSEVQENDEWATEAGLESYDSTSMVTPEHSGLENPEAMRAARDAGVRYLVGDTTVPGYEPPSPNAGLYSTFAPEVLLIPRYPNNLFFDVSTPEEWTDEYNEKYRDFWGEDRTYEEILDRESEVLLTYLLKGDVNPLMFHQANLRAYDGTHTLLGDLLDRTLEKYEGIFNLPILSPTMDDLGDHMAERMRYNAAGVAASVVPGGEIRLTAQSSVRVPVTGLRSSSSSDAADEEYYGGQYTSYVDLEAGESVTLQLQG